LGWQPRPDEQCRGDTAALGTEIDWAHSLVHLDVGRQQVSNSPLYDPSITVDGAYEEKFLTYYDIKWLAA